ncbi:MAG TPA: M20/M25/M40 family metallo-hydrolase [Baekduia sp.]|nr:M20/M25/M40 family metallo-hydrolase [Baekduia sp.]
MAESRSSVRHRSHPPAERNNWIATAAESIAARAERELEALVAVSSPSGDIAAAEEAIAVVVALLPAAATVQRVPCSSPEHADDLIARVTGTGDKRLLLLGHLDTVVPHAEHRPLTRDGDRLTGSGTVDMKGGDVLALGVMRELAERPELFAEVALLFVVDEEWRSAPFAHAQRFAGFDACLCFEGGQRGPDGGDEVVVKRKAAGTIHVQATGRAAHSGSQPELGRNALVAIATAALAVAECNDPAGPDRLTAVPTIGHAGEALNVVPGTGELLCDVRADSQRAFQRVIDAIPREHEGVSLDVTQLREWPGMDARLPTEPVLQRAGALLGRAIGAEQRGGASDASHLATVIETTIDGLGPIGDGAHAADEYVLTSSLRPRAEVALAVAIAALGG